MKVYRYVAAAEGYSWLSASASWSFGEGGLSAFRHCKPIGASWRPPVFEMVQERLGPPDFPGLFTWAPVFSRRALRILEPIIGWEIEPLPLAPPNEAYYAINVLDVVDALDEAASDISRFANGEVMCIDKHIFRADELRGHDFFKLPQIKGQDVFLSERFVAVAKEHGLTGLIYRRVFEASELG